MAILRKSVRCWWPVTLALPLAGLLSACASFTPGVTPQQAPATGYAGGDLSGVVLAFDVPVVLQPADDEPSRLSYNVVTDSGERYIVAELTFAEVDVSETLPAPANNRTYYLYSVVEKDKAALGEAQTLAGAMTPVLSVAPSFCATGPIDLQKATISVLVLSPGQATAAPLVSNQPLAAVLTASRTTLSACQ